MKITKDIDYYGTICYYNEQGQWHREDGPAVEWSDGDKYWYINDKEYSEQEFNNLILKKRLQKILEL
jgi:hypothetical protein